MNVPERIETLHMRGTVAIIIVLESLTTTTLLIFYLNIQYKKLSGVKDLQARIYKYNEFHFVVCVCIFPSP